MCNLCNLPCSIKFLHFHKQTQYFERKYSFNMLKLFYTNIIVMEILLIHRFEETLKNCNFFAMFVQTIHVASIKPKNATYIKQLSFKYYFVPPSFCNIVVISHERISIITVTQSMHFNKTLFHFSISTN